MDLCQTNRGGRSHCRPGGEASAVYSAFPPNPMIINHHKHHKHHHEQDEQQQPPQFSYTPLFLSPSHSPFTHPPTGLSSPSQPSFPLLPAPMKERRNGLLPCPWGNLFNCDGHWFQCSYSKATVSNGKRRQHWARQHVANEVFSIRRGFLNMGNARFITTEDKLKAAIRHLGICPNRTCCDGSQYRIWDNRSGERRRHLASHPHCASHWGETSPRTKGDDNYGDLAEILGYVRPNKKRRQVVPEGCLVIDGCSH